LIEVRNHADNTAYAAEKALREFGDKVPADLKTEIEAKVAGVKKIAEGEDVVSIKAATEDLGQAIQKIGASVYEAQNPPASTGQASDETDEGSSSKEDGPEVVDGEVHE
jgi:molecular chaperone DnaK